MFRRTNTMWKVLALALCLCMLPTVAMATTNTVGITYDAEAEANAERVQLTVTHGSGEANKEITILAIRKADEAVYEGEDGDEGVYDADALAEDLTGRIVYIDQETTNAEGKVTFDFIPAATAASTNGAIDVYVGGAGVEAVQMITVVRRLASPEAAIAEGTWEAGDALVIELSGAVAEDEAALEAWFESISCEVTAEGEEGTFGPIPELVGTTIILPWDDVRDLTITGITFTSNSHNDVEVDGLGEGLAAALKTPGTLEVVDVDYVSATETTVYVTIDDEEYAAAMDAETTTIKIDEEPVVEYGLEGNELTLTMPVFDTEEAEHVVSIEVDCYEPAEVEVALVAPTKAVADELDIEATYTGEFYDDDEAAAANGVSPYDPGEADEDKKNIMWGKLAVTLPTEDAETGATFDWTVDGVPVEAEGEETEIVVDIARDWAEDLSYEIAAVVSISDFATSSYETTITAPQLGREGVAVEVEVNFEAADAAATATVTLGEYELELSEGTTFAHAAVVPGEYTLTVVRPGYVKVEATVTVLPSGEIQLEDGSAFTTGVMIFGDITSNTGEPDGRVNSRDYNALLDAYNVAENYDLKFDFNGDGRVNSRDYNKLLDYYGYPTSNNPNA